MLGWGYEAAVLLLFTKLEFVIKIFCFTKQRGNFKISAENSLKKCIQSSNFHAHLDCLWFIQWSNPAKISILPRKMCHKPEYLYSVVRVGWCYLGFVKVFRFKWARGFIGLMFSVIKTFWLLLVFLPGVLHFFNLPNAILVFQCRPQWNG